MKKILLALGFLLPVLINAQTIQYLGSPTTQIYIRGQLRVDSIVYLPLRDTTFTPSQIGALVIKSSNGGLYLWNGLKWNTVPVGSTAWGTITGSINSQSDLISLLNGYQPALTAGYGVKLVSNTLRWDSANVRKVDTVYRTDDSTISYAINGHVYSVLIRGTAAGGINSLTFNVPGVLYTSPILFSNTGGAWSGTEVLNSQASNTFFAGPVNGSPAQPGFRAQVLADLPTGIPNANLANPSIGLSLTNTGSTPTWTGSSVALGGTAVLNVPYASSTNSGFLSNTDWINFNAAATPPVTSVNAQLGAVVVGNGDSIKKLPIDTSSRRNGYALTFDSVNHKWILAPGSTTSGTVTSVALTVPSYFSVAGSPVTGAGTLAVTAINQSANTVLAGPTSGGSAAPGYRSLVNADFPVSGVTGGTYNSVTVNAQGIVTGASVVGSGITSLNGLTAGTQTFATGTSGSDFNISSIGTAHTFNFPDASASNRGLLTSADWTSFNIKQVAGNYVTGGTGDVVFTGPGAVPATIQANAVTTSKIINSAVTLPKLANGTANTLVGFDASGVPIDVSLTTTGSSGPAQIISGVLNIPQYSGSSTTLGVKGIAFGNASNAVAYDTTKLKFDSAGNGHTYHFVNSSPVGKRTDLFYGNSETVGFPTPSIIFPYPIEVTNKLGDSLSNLAISGRTLQNTGWAGATGFILGDTGTIPTYVPGTSGYLFNNIGVNDIRAFVAGNDSSTFRSAYRLWVIAAERKGWPATMMCLIAPVYIPVYTFKSDSIAYSFPAAATPARQLGYVISVQAVCTEFGLKFVNGYTATLGLDQYYQADSLHMARYANNRVAAAILSAMDTVRLSNQTLAVNGTVQLGQLTLNNTPTDTTKDLIYPLGLSTKGVVSNILNANYNKVMVGAGALYNDDIGNLIVNGRAKMSALYTNGYIPIPTAGSGIYLSNFVSGTNSTIASHNWGAATNTNLSIQGYGGQTSIGTLSFTADGAGLYSPTFANLGGAFITGTSSPSVGAGVLIKYSGGAGYIYATDVGVAAHSIFLGFGGSRINIGGSSDDGVHSLQVPGSTKLTGIVGVATSASATANLFVGASTSLISALRFTSAAPPTALLGGNFNYSNGLFIGDSSAAVRDTFATRSWVRSSITSGSGVTTVGAFSGSSQTNGASISTNTITFGPADATNPGMMSTGTQTFAGTKTFNSGPIVPTQSLGTNNGTVASTGYVDGSLNAYAAIKLSHTIFTPTTGGTVSLVNRQYNIINPAGTLVALTVNLPSSPVNNDVVFIKFTQNITTVTYANGTVVDGITAPTAGGLTVLTYDAGTTSWY